jgi:hypothetical protein
MDISREQALKSVFRNVESSLEALERWFQKEEDTRPRQTITDAITSLENFGKTVGAEPVQDDLAGIKNKLKMQVTKIQDQMRNDPALAQALGSLQDDFSKKLQLVGNLLKEESKRTPKVGGMETMRGR